MGIEMGVGVASSSLPCWWLLLLDAIYGFSVRLRVLCDIILRKRLQCYGRGDAANGVVFVVDVSCSELLTEGQL
jgi:hypothetical protein